MKKPTAWLLLKGDKLEDVLYLLGPMTTETY